jgi:hypothetical protein
MNTDKQVYDWLLEPSNPSVRYRTMTELLDRKKDEVEVVQAKEHIFSSQMVTQILSKMRPDGYWLQKKPSTNEFVGDGVVMVHTRPHISALLISRNWGSIAKIHKFPKRLIDILIYKKQMVIFSAIYLVSLVTIFAHLSCLVFAMIPECKNLLI